MAETRQDGRPSYTGVWFDGTNFDSWQFGVKLAIQSEELWRIVNGTELRPEPIREEKSRPLMSCTLAQEMWTKMETMWTDSAADLAPLLWNQFYGCKFLPGQTVMEFMSEVEHIVSRLRAIDGIVLLDNQIIAKITMSLPPKMKLIFKAAWESTAAAERTLRNLTTRLAQLEKEVKQCEEEKMAEALLSSKKIDPAQPST
ncbi:Uncharacterized protein APZ42_004024, partial [Daphnia magna]